MAALRRRLNLPRGRRTAGNRSLHMALTCPVSLRSFPRSPCLTSPLPSDSLARQAGRLEKMAARAGWRFCPSCVVLHKPAPGAQPTDPVERLWRLDRARITRAWSGGDAVVQLWHEAADAAAGELDWLKRHPSALSKQQRDSATAAKRLERARELAQVSQGHVYPPEDRAGRAPPSTWYQTARRAHRDRRLRR